MGSLQEAILRLLRPYVVLSLLFQVHVQLIHSFLVVMSGWWDILLVESVVIEHLFVVVLKSSSCLRNSCFGLTSFVCFYEIKPN